MSSSNFELGHSPLAGSSGARVFERNDVPQLALHSIPKRDVPAIDLISVSRSAIGKIKKKGELRCTDI
ncbi:hypothetical protein HYDPIDRAFT_111502 [Hydnomerulius pinastri MD-312]|uniref:Uncharacterized protein n=1 Tax=Hydnomerulius pinastri MD-312 TaxID=994086 RepID=A0A0C9WAA9_9AGAM|nr:hypothetical protein HYDPIDRAFT_111502 [Hydnomerulius pinastri MD-312]